MAVAIERTRVLGKSVTNATLLDAVVATGNGEWIDIRGLVPFSIHISGITTATLQVRGSNASSKPADATHGVQIGSNITSDTINEYSVPLRWIKIRVTTWAAGTITAEFESSHS